MISSDRNAMATPIRFPSTANLQIDSMDRARGTSSNFSITKQGNIMTGFFTRFGVVEITMLWEVANISAAFGNDVLIVDVENAGTTKTYIGVLVDGNYTVASALNELVVTLNADIATDPLSDASEFYLTSAPLNNIAGMGTQYLQCGTVTGTVSTTLRNITVHPGLLQQQLGLKTTAATFNSISRPNLAPYNYLDFVCSNLTYQQGLKDATTGTSSRDVLYRWVFAWDVPPPQDEYGYPIFQGYQPFNARRYLSCPKQVKWDGQQSLGQMQFEVYANGQDIVPVNPGDGFEWQMNLLVSEQ